MPLCVRACARQGWGGGGGGVYGSLGCMREAGLEASHAAGQHGTQAVGVEAASEHLQVSGAGANNQVQASENPV